MAAQYNLKKTYHNIVTGLEWKKKHFPLSITPVVERIIVSLFTEDLVVIRVPLYLRQGSKLQANCVYIC